MTKRYDESIDVTCDPGSGGAPIAFSWRGHTYQVDRPLGSWLEAGEWWNGSARRDREYFRVLARPAGSLASGDLDPDGFMTPTGAVYDVYRDRVDGKGWRLARVWD